MSHGSAGDRIAAGLGSILLGSRKPERLREWYAEVLGARPCPDGFLDVGSTFLLIDERPQLAPRAVETSRVSLRFDVPDLSALLGSGRCDVRQVAVRQSDGTTAALLEDPDGSLLLVSQAADVRPGGAG